MDEALIDSLSNLDDEAVVKAVLHAKQRNALSDSDFAYIDSKGGRHLPIHDASHVRNALARFDQTHFESSEAKARALAKIRAAAKRFGVDVDDGDADDVKKSETGFFVTISKADVEHGVIYGVVNQANLIDHQKDVIRPDELRKACWGFMVALQKGEIDGAPVDDTHQFGDIPGVVVECWMDADDNWRIGYKPDDIEIAKAAERGDYVGWSIFGQGERVEV